MRNNTISALNEAVDTAITQYKNRVRISHICIDLTSHFEAEGFGFDGSLKVATEICEALKSCKKELNHDNIWELLK